MDASGNVFIGQADNCSKKGGGIYTTKYIKKKLTF